MWIHITTELEMKTDGNENYFIILIGNLTLHFPQLIDLSKKTQHHEQDLTWNIPLQNSNIYILLKNDLFTWYA